MDAYQACEKKSVQQLSHEVLTPQEAAENFRKEFQCLTFKSGNGNVAEKQIEEKMNAYVHQPHSLAPQELVNAYNQLTKPGLSPNLSKARVLPDGSIDITANNLR